MAALLHEEYRCEAEGPDTDTWRSMQNQLGHGPGQQTLGQFQGQIHGLWVPRSDAAQSGTSDADILRPHAALLR
jgi:hypothetical protein